MMVVQVVSRGFGSALALGSGDQDGDVLTVQRHPWRAFHRGWRLFTMNVRPPRRTTLEPAFCFNDRSEFLTFIASSS